jgi:phosphatidylserine decarboxylase
MLPYSVADQRRPALELGTPLSADQGTMPNLSLGERIVQSAWRVMPKRLYSRMVGWTATQRFPRPLQSAVLRLYARAYRLDCAEAEHPIGEYQNLQAFFTRRLARGARALPSNEKLIVAPSDGVVCEAGIATEGKLLEAKGSMFSLRSLLADDALAERMAGGSYLVTYLSPRDYHRVHFPMRGLVVAWSHIPGKLFPVGSRSVKREPGLFARNERFVTVVDGVGGRYAVVMVAAVGVGHMTASYDPEVATHDGGFSNGSVRHKRLSPPISVNRGQELGVFNLGSTTIALFERGRVALDDLASGQPVRMGQPVGRIIAS